MDIYGSGFKGTVYILSFIHNARVVGFHATSHHMKSILQDIIFATVMFVSFLQGLVLKTKNNKTSLNFSFSSYHNTTLQLSTNNILTLGSNSESLYEVNQNKRCVLSFFSLPRRTKRKPRGGGKLSAFCVVEPV